MRFFNKTQQQKSTEERRASIALKGSFAIALKGSLAIALKDSFAIALKDSFAIATTTLFFSFLPWAKAQSTQQWQPLTELISRPQALQIIRENVSDRVDRAELLQRATGYQQGDLLMVTFNHSDMCGRGGCWVFGYVGEEKVLGTQSTGLGAERPIVELIDDGTTIPCIRLAHYTEIPLMTPEEEIFCYVDEEWVSE